MARKIKNKKIRGGSMGPPPFNKGDLVRVKPSALSDVSIEYYQNHIIGMRSLSPEIIRKYVELYVDNINVVLECYYSSSASWQVFVNQSGDMSRASYTFLPQDLELIFTK